MEKKLIVSNWKMYGSAGQVADWLGTVDDYLANDDAMGKRVDCVFCPPAIFLPRAGDSIAKHDMPVMLGAQDVSAHATGAHTGQVSADMLAEMSVQMAIIGHSERRSEYAETDADCYEKMTRCIEAHITPILCIGESREQYQQNATKEVIEKQLSATIGKIAVACDIVIAYEPIWAIGSGQTPSMKEIADVASFIREIAARTDHGGTIRVLYGGSVDDANARDILGLSQCDGLLVGRASLSAKAFLAICGGCRDADSVGHD